MLKLSKITPLLILCFIIITINLHSQTVIDRKSSGKKQSPNFVERLWYGASLNLGFNSFNNESTFLIGLSPMVGYKITENFSFGPRIVFNYQNSKLRFGNNIIKFNAFEYGGGVFSRYKFFDVVFVHGEFNYISRPNNFFSNGEVQNEAQPGLLLGLGYNGGGGEIYLLYDFLRDTDQSLEMPIELRFGFTLFF